MATKKTVKTEEMMEMEEMMEAEEMMEMEEMMEAEEKNPDPWAEENYEEVFVPKRTRGEQGSEVYMVNGNRYTVPKGKTVKVPAPIAELVRRHEEQVTRTMEQAEEAFGGSAVPQGNYVNTTRNI